MLGLFLVTAHQLCFFGFLSCCLHAFALSAFLQRKIDHEARLLQANASKFGKQTAQWIKLVDQFNSALKEIGDVRNWAATIEADLVHVCEVLERVQREQPSAAGESTQDSPADASATQAASSPDADVDADGDVDANTNAAMDSSSSTNVNRSGDDEDNSGVSKDDSVSTKNDEKE